jgi:hypothetical protein
MTHPLRIEHPSTTTLRRRVLAIIPGARLVEEVRGLQSWYRVTTSAGIPVGPWSMSRRGAWWGTAQWLTTEGE